MIQENSKHLIKFLKAVANMRRLKIVQLLSKSREMTVSNIAASIRLSFRSTSHHLRILRAADIVEPEQHGLEVRYHLNAETMYHELLHKICKEL